MSLEKELTNAKCALSEILKYNPLRNDLDAYLFELTHWGLGKRKIKPNASDYNLQ